MVRLPKCSTDCITKERRKRINLFCNSNSLSTELLCKGTTYRLLRSCVISVGQSCSHDYEVLACCLVDDVNHVIELVMFHACYVDEYWGN